MKPLRGTSAAGSNRARLRLEQPGQEPPKKKARSTGAQGVDEGAGPSRRFWSSNACVGKENGMPHGEVKAEQLADSDVIDLTPDSPEVELVSVTQVASPLPDAPPPVQPPPSAEASRKRRCSDSMPSCSSAAAAAASAHAPAASQPPSQLDSTPDFTPPSQPDSTPASQPVLKRRRINGRVAAGEHVPRPPAGVVVREQAAGQIFRVELINFMCHSRFLVEPHPHITFITGTNGSGKSSVLQGLQWALGAKAMMTGRNSAASNWIRQGSSHMAVHVSLWNTGPDAFEPERLGPLLTVSRQLTSRGTATVVVKDAAGREVYKRMSDVKKLREHFNIDTENPVIVMTQDKAREFFCSSQISKDLFRFWVQALQYDRIWSHLQGAQDSVAEVEDVLNEAQAGLKEVEEQVGKLAERAEALQDLEKQKAELKRAEDCHAWSIVKDCEGRLEKLQRHRADGAEQARASVLRHLADFEEKLQEAQQRLQAAEEELQQHAQRRQQRDATLREHSATIRDRKAEVARKQQAVKEQQRSIRSKQLELQQVEKVYREAQQQQQAAASDNGPTEQEEWARKLAELEAKAVEAAAAKQVAQQEKEAAAEAVTQAADEAKRCSRAAQAAVQDVRTVQEQLAGLQRCNTNPLARFGELAVALAPLLQRHAAEFDRRPVGPIGSLLALSDSSWNVAVEVVLGDVFSTYIVHSHRDEKRLKQLARDACRSAASGTAPRTARRPDSRQLRIIVRSFDIADYRARMAERAADVPPPDMLTLQKVLRYAAADVEQERLLSNALIDSKQVERVLLVPGAREGNDLIYSQNRELLRRFKEVAALESRLADRRSEADGLQRQAQEAQQAESTARARRDESARKLLAANRRKAAADSQLEGQRAYDPKDEADESQLEELQDDMRKVRTDLEQAQQQLEQQQGSVAESQERLAAAEAEKEAFRTAPDDVQGQHAAEQRRGRCRQAVEDRERQLEEVRGKQRSIEEQIQQLEARLAEVSAELEAERQKACEVCSEEAAAASRQYLQHQCNWPERELCTKTIDSRCQKLRARISGGRAAVMGATLQDVERELASAQRRKRSAKERNRRLQRHWCSLSRSAGQRHEGQARIQHSVEDNIRTVFARNLCNGVAGAWHGNVEVGHEVQKVKITVYRPNDSRPITDLKTLSGGERSSLSLALVLALVQVAEVPFFALDEFDVFMDAATRMKSIMALFQHAQQHPHRQFLFISPQDAQQIEKARQEYSNRLAPRKKLPPLNPDDFETLVVQPARPS